MNRAGYRGSIDLVCVKLKGLLLTLLVREESCSVRHDCCWCERTITADLSNATASHCLSRFAMVCC
jgi:hypothetical protein